MDLLLPEHAGHDTHLSGTVLGNINDCQSAAPVREQRVVPPEKAVVGKRLLVMDSSIQHHVHDTVDVPGRVPALRDVDPKTAGYRETHLVGIQDDPLNLGRRHDIVGDGLHDRPHPRIQTDGAEPPCQETRLLIDPGQCIGNLFVIPDEMRPLRGVVDILHHTSFFAKIVFFGLFATIKPQNLRLINRIHVL